MRVISQNGEIDLPYEHIVISRNGNCIHCNFLTENNTDCIIGIYSTAEKAEKAMEMLRDKYLSRMELNGGYDMVSGCYVQPNYWVLPKVFQFPQDSEVVTDET